MNPRKSRWKIHLKTTDGKKKTAPVDISKISLFLHDFNDISGGTCQISSINRISSASFGFSFWFFIISFHRKTTGAPSGTRAARLVGVESWFPKRREQPGHQQIARRKVPWQVGNYLEDHPKTWIRGKSLVGGLNQPLWKILISQIGSFSPNKGWT